MSLLSAYVGKAANSVCVYSVPLLHLVMLDLIHNLVTYPPLKSPTMNCNFEHVSDLSPTMNCNFEHVSDLSPPESDKLVALIFKPIPKKAVKARGTGSL